MVARTGTAILFAAVLALGAAGVTAPVQAEWNLDVYAGPTYEHEDSDPGALTIGGRVGYFFPFVGRLDGGLFADSSVVLDDDDPVDVEFDFVPTTALALLRYRLIDAADFGLHPYFGAGPSLVWSRLDVAGDDDSEIDLGLDARAGLRAILLDRFALFAEYRLNYFEAKFDNIQGSAAQVDDVFHAALFGVGYRFVAAPPPPAPVVLPASEPTPEPVAELPPPTRQRIVLRGVTFDFDTDVLSRDAEGVLDAAVAALQDAPTTDVVVAGHSDAIGAEEYNMKLSERRATRVRNYLADHGIDASRLEVRAYGESSPVADNDTEEGRAQNRRVELDVTE